MKRDLSIFDNGSGVVVVFAETERARVFAARNLPPVWEGYRGHVVDAHAFAHVANAMKRDKLRAEYI